MAFWKRESGKLLFIDPSAIVSLKELDTGNVEVALANGHIHKLAAAEAGTLLPHLEGCENTQFDGTRWVHKPDDNPYPASPEPCSDPKPLSCPVTTLASGSVGVPYSQTVVVECPAGTLVNPGNFHVTLGTLPAGLSLDLNTGVISGTPTSIGLSSFTVSANGLNATGCHDFTLAIN